MKKQLFTVHLNHLSNDEAASLFVQTGEYAIPVKSYLGEMATAALNDFVPKATAFSAQVSRQRKSKFTVNVQADRNVSTNLFAEIKRTIVFESKSRDTAHKQATGNFGFFFEPYSDYSTGPIGPQMEQTQEMMLKYKADTALKSDAQLIGVDTLMTELETDNNSLMAVYQTRTKETGNRETSSTDLRPGTTESYVQLCTVIEQGVNLTPNEQMLSLFNSMNELRKKHNALISKPKDNGTDAPAV